MKALYEPFDHVVPKNFKLKLCYIPNHGVVVIRCARVVSLESAIMASSTLAANEYRPQCR